SRRRHTRFSRDWSSDVCSSDLRRNLDLRARLRAVVVASPLRDQVAETMATLDQRKAEGAQPERLYELVEQSRGTPCLADWMGYEIGRASCREGAGDWWLEGRVG